MKKVSSRNCFTLAVTFYILSIMWFGTHRFSLGLVQAVVATAELCLGFYYRHKEKNGD